MTDPVLTIWRFSARRSEQALVLPDGCRDLIIETRPGRPPRRFVSDLDDATRLAPIEEGARFLGFRLRPGVTIAKEALLDWAARSDPTAEGLAEFCALRPDAGEALRALAAAPDIAAAAREIGVSTRTLERTARARTGAPPRFWLSLARARRCARGLPGAQGLAEAAFAFGYADQAHMTRDLRRWFGKTPRRIRADAALQSLLREPGYG